MDWFGDLKSSIAVQLRLLLAMLLIAVSGCSGGFKQWLNNDHKVGPDYCPPSTIHANDWIDAENPHLIGEPENASCWWAVFNDPVLNEIINIAYERNLSLSEAGFRVYEARLRLGITQSDLLPQSQDAFASYSRTQLSETSFPANLGTPRAFDTWELGLFRAAWELDVWGRLRRNIESSTAAVDASVHDYDAILVMLIGDVASSYMRMCTLAQQLAYNDQNIDTQRKSLVLAKTKFENGDVSELDVEQAQTNLATTIAQRSTLELELRLIQNNLCFLLGMPPEDLSPLLAKPLPSDHDARDSNPTVEPWIIPFAPEQVAAGVPADLVRRRPDVRLAERKVAEQCARIGIAYADLFPTFTIQGDIEYRAADALDVFSGASQAGFIASPGIEWKILNYGRIRDNIDIQDARFQQAIYAYQQTVLTANREVEDFLAGFILSQKRYRAELDASNAAMRALQLAQVQYEEGAIDFNRVFTLQTNLLTQQQELAEARQDINLNLIGVYRGLGGGWQIRLGNKHDCVGLVSQ